MELRDIVQKKDRVEFVIDEEVVVIRDAKVINKIKQMEDGTAIRVEDVVILRDADEVVITDWKGEYNVKLDEI